uniref:K Homology domain-containing protein n=1 Tax=Globodera rostochiensis TaxID=31243 RepID=A0A914HD89_GLORO
MSDDLKFDDTDGSIIGQKRQNPENGGPASKKANVGDSDNLQIKVLIPSAAVGALIGKGGETMRNLKNDSGCRVQMSKNQEVYHGTSERICLVKGKLASTMIVMGAILEKIQEKIDANHAADHFDLKGLDRTKEMKFVVPNTSAGMVIGKNGASIKEIRDTTTANIQIFPKAGSEEAKISAERVITVGHESNDVLLSAVQRVLEKVVADPMHAQPISSETQTSSGFDFSGSRVSTGSSQFGGISNLVNSSDSLHGKAFGGSSYKFNPLQGTGNNELLSFLDNLQSTLRSSGFNDQSVSEVMQAMQVLAKYNIMGLGLGLGVAAMAQMRNTESAMAPQNVLLNASNSLVQQQRYEMMSQSNFAGSILESKPNIDQSIVGGSGGVLIDVMSQKKTGSNGGNSFANSVIKERIVEDGHTELEVPDNIIGAVLGPRATTLIEIQQLSGCKIEVHKRGSNTASPGGRVVSLTGDNNSIMNGRIMIEKVINQEQQRRSMLGTR